MFKVEADGELYPVGDVLYELDYHNGHHKHLENSALCVQPVAAESPRQQLPPFSGTSCVMERVMRVAIQGPGVLHI
jgi:hypothetical protein